MDPVPPQPQSPPGVPPLGAPGRSDNGLAKPPSIPLGGPVPLHPPQQKRTDPGGLVTGAGPAPVAPPAPEPEPEPVETPLITTSRGWGWRTLAAFVAGGALAAAGFLVGQRSEQEAAATETAEATTPVIDPVERELATQPPVTLARDGTVESAQLVAELLGPSVVQIENGDGIGSGVIYRDGLVLTNQHVIGAADTVGIVLSDGRELEGTVVGTEPNVDVAVIDLGPNLGLPVAELASGERVQVGQTAIAIGSPFRLQQTVTEGIVSAVDRPIRSGQFYTAMIQTDASINPGNSGGALADRFGRVIGINTAIQTTTNTNMGVGFAIPIDTAVSIADRLVAGEPVIGGFLGVEGGAPANGAAGVEVRSITPGSGAEASGLQAGDRILSIDGAPVTLFEELAGLVAARVPGDVVELEVVRGDEVLALEATLGQR